MNAPQHFRSAQGLASIRALNLGDPGECARIDSWVMAQAAGSPFHRPKWLNAIERATGQEAHCLIAEAGGEIAGILPLHIMHSPLFGRALVSSGFAVGGGILSGNPVAVKQLAEAAWQFAERRSCPTVELRGGAMPGGAWTEKSDAHANFARALTSDDEAELLAIPRKQRAEVRKGLANGLRITTGNGRQDRRHHYAIYAESVRNLGTPVFPQSLMDAVLDGFGDQADILTVLDGDRPVASVLSLYHNGIVMPYWGGGIWDARRLRANDVMYYALMNHARQKGCHSFDFGRSKTGSGAYHFKKNWGFEPDPLSYAVRTADGGEPRDVNPNSPKYKMQIALWQRLPLSIANRLGPWIAKGLG
ncbi:FemAB family XrtA/PEP-CTERM system-associated protein [Sphingorhabdus arenilitoris]|uniref:FemAB family XrtA/PEP-CTERM system-associated protein n=1 Tax=Sphingorhabdus arenilitoris TaxID=1490041 RepID=A0ABV8RE38_9SPHN